ncbi:ABC transporter permease [Virgibacillus ainsalahensis]
MYSVIMAQWLKDKRKPYIIILFIGLSILATLVFGDTTRQNETNVAIFADGPNAEEIEQKWEGLLNANNETKFVITDEKTAREQVAEGNRDVAIRVMENDYRLITSSDMPNIQLVEQQVHQVFVREAQLQAAAGSTDAAALRDEVDAYLANPPVTVQTQTPDGEDIPQHNMGTQLLFGFTLFIAMFTIGFKVNGVPADKVNGIWDRLILSPVSKTNMYAGHLIYSFCVGFFQMSVVFFIFHYVMGYELGNLPMILVLAAVFTLSTVSMAMLIAGIAKTPEKFNMIYPSLVPIIPVISGVYMPPGTISNPVLQFIADLFPLTYGVDAMMDVTLFDAGWSDITLPIAFMLLIGVLYMGVGINLIERRKG